MKVSSEHGDAHPNGSYGTVIGSIGPIQFEGREKVYSYFVEWDTTNGAPVSVIDVKLRTCTGDDFGVEPDDKCNRYGCSGVMRKKDRHGCCSCHISPPCRYCMLGVICDVCDSETEDA